MIEKEKTPAFAREYENIPPHTDEEYATAAPFGRLIAPGVMSFIAVWAKYPEADFFGKSRSPEPLMKPAACIQKTDGQDGSPFAPVKENRRNPNAIHRQSL